MNDEKKDPQSAGWLARHDPEEFDRIEDEQAKNFAPEEDNNYEF